MIRLQYKYIKHLKTLQITLTFFIFDPTRWTSSCRICWRICPPSGGTRRVTRAWSWACMCTASRSTARSGWTRGCASCSCVVCRMPRSCWRRSRRRIMRREVRRSGRRRVRRRLRRRPRGRCRRGLRLMPRVLLLVSSRSIFVTLFIYLFVF